MRPGRSAVIALAAFLARDWKIATSYKLPFVFGLVNGAASLLLLRFLGRVVDERGSGLEDLESGYFAFAAIGIAVLGVLQVGLTAFAIGLRTEQTTGTFEALLTSPAPAWVVIAGSAGFGVLREVLTAAATLAAAALAFGLPVTGGAEGVALGAVVLVGCLGLFLGLGILISALTVTFQQTLVFVAPIVTVLGVLCGVYYPVEVLPGWAEAIAHAIPFTWALDLLRDALLRGTVDPGLLAALFAAAAAAVPLSLWSFDRALARARRRGSLGTY